MSATDVGKTLSKINENICKVFKDGVKIATDPKHTDADVEKFWQDIDKVGIGSTEDSLKEAYAQAKAAATKHLMDRGWTHADIDSWFNPRWEKIKNAAEKARGYVPKVEKAAQSAWRTVVGFVGAIAALAAGTVIYAFFFKSGPTPEERAALAVIHQSQTQRMQINHLSEIMISAQEFRIMIGDLSPAPMPTITLPAPVQAVATAPVQVTVTTPTGSREFISNVERVYRSSPEPVRQRIEETVDRPAVDRSGGGHHKTFTVRGTPFGSATFSY
jgi:hypothetical protein